MNMLDSKVIQSKFETEIYIDDSTNIELSHFHAPMKNDPYYECMVGLKFIRIRENKIQRNKISYFGIRMTENRQSIIIVEPELQSIFATKNQPEKDATVELIEYLLTESPAFKQMTASMVKQTD